MHPDPEIPSLPMVCFKGGCIDAWGRGALKLPEACQEADLPESEMKHAFRKENGKQLSCVGQHKTGEQLI